MKKSVLAVSLLTALSGCNSDVAEHDPFLPQPTEMQGQLRLDAELAITQPVLCNAGDAADFRFVSDEAISCVLEETVIASFPAYDDLSRHAQEKVAFSLADATNLAGDNMLINAQWLFKKLADEHQGALTIPADKQALFQSFYTDERLTLATNDFQQQVEAMLNPPTPEEPEEPSANLTVQFSLDGQIVFDDSVLCNGLPASNFDVKVGDTVVCQLDGIPLATFSNVQADQTEPNRSSTQHKTLRLAEADEFIQLAADAPNLHNAQSLLKKYGVVIGHQIHFHLDGLARLEFANLYQQDLALSTEAFDALLAEDATEEQADKLPSAHVPDIQPAVSAGASSNLAGSFVAANAEEAYQYQPATAILTTGKLTDSQGKAVAGMSYFSPSARGVTAEDGSFEFMWGESILFGIETFELGGFRGNQTQISLKQLADGVIGENIEHLVQRYADEAIDHWQISDKLKAEFAQYPNVINEFISLSLSSQDQVFDLGNGQSQTLAAEFFAQFKVEGSMAQQLDAALCQRDCDGQATRQAVRASEAQQSVLSQVQQLWGSSAQAQADGWLPVTRFHVFHDSTNFYGNTGNARGQAVVNTANTAFPILMARTDGNYWLDFGAQKAWDEDGLAYITEAPSLVEPDRVSAETATFNLPFIAAGEIGQGKVMMLGNGRYNSILVCPTNYSWQGSKTEGECRSDRLDSLDMQHFFKNTFRYLTGMSDGFTVGTNIPTVYFKRQGQTHGHAADYVIDASFNVSTEQVSDFSNLDPKAMPLLILNGFDIQTAPFPSHYTLPYSADLSKPKLSQDDATALINYVAAGGNILVMETILSSDVSNDDAAGLFRLLDSAGISTGVSSQSTVLNGNGPGNGYLQRPRATNETGLYVLERYAAIPDEDTEQAVLPYVINEDGSVDWRYQLEGKPDDKPELELASWITTAEDGTATTHYASFAVTEETDIEAEKKRILDAFAVDGQWTYQECTDPNYHYEVNCLEFRPGNHIPLAGIVPRYTEINLGEPEAKAMIQAADLGTNIERLYQHEVYFRTRGKEGERLSSSDLNRLYSNMSVWLWNNLDYRYEVGAEDELGFERFTEFLNCYTQNQGGAGTTCPSELAEKLVSLKMIYGEAESENAAYAGWMNPSYPLNYMEKPLTRLMLGRSYWDLDVKVDPRAYPGVATDAAKAAQINLDLAPQSGAWFAGARQATGQWAIAHQPFTVSVTDDQPVTITVMLADDLTGREKHELGLQRPPRMSKSFTLNAEGIGQSHTFIAPYGGLIYAQGRTDNVTFSFSGTVAAPLYDHASQTWRNPQTAGAPMGELVGKAFMITTASQNLLASNYVNGAAEAIDNLDKFASDLNDFYGRNERGGVNAMVTGEHIPNRRHHMVNDVAISIGAAHSGYPVMNTRHQPTSTHLNHDGLSSWLVHHEVGHNAAEAPFNVTGATEVVNNLLGLYMQDKYAGQMNRVAVDIRIAPDFVASEHGKAWAIGGPAERLVMFAQLKTWAETEFDIHTWYDDALPSFYSQVDGLKGWNLFKLMHRLVRNPSEGKMPLAENFCRGNWSDGDRLMICMSYATQTDLTDFFIAWNPGSTAQIAPGVETPLIQGGISQAAIAAVQAMQLEKPKRDPLQINRLN